MNNRVKNYKQFVNEKWNYNNNNSINILIKNSRKWSEKDFIEEYVYLNDINYILDMNGKYTLNIEKGDVVILARIKRDDSGKQVYKDGLPQNIPYKKVTANKDYIDKNWKFIMDNTKELQNQAREIYRANKGNEKPEFEKDSKIIEAYHVSPFKFNQFKYQKKSISGQIGADVGFFFFLNKNDIDYYSSVLKDNNGQVYIYTVNIQIGNQLELKGEDVGTNWGRQAELSQAEIEGYNTVIVRNADTGYGITDELIVFDDDDIKIIKIIKK